MVTVVDEEAARTNATGPGLSGAVLDEIGDTVLEESEELGVNVTVENVERFGEWVSKFECLHELNRLPTSRCLLGGEHHPTLHHGRQV